MPATVILDMPSRDLLGRLLHIDPQQRLRSLYSLERIAMYKGYPIADVRRRKVNGLLPVMLFVYNQPFKIHTLFAGVSKIPVNSQRIRQLMEL